MRIGVLTETEAGETRVAVVPESVKKYAALGAEIVVQAGAGKNAGIPDAEFESAGARIAGSAAEAADEVADHGRRHTPQRSTPRGPPPHHSLYAREPDVSAPFPPPDSCIRFVCTA